MAASQNFRRRGFRCLEPESKEGKRKAMGGDRGAHLHPHAMSLSTRSTTKSTTEYVTRFTTRCHPSNTQNPVVSLAGAHTRPTPYSLFRVHPGV